MLPLWLADHNSSLPLTSSSTKQTMVLNKTVTSKPTSKFSSRGSSTSRSNTDLHCPSNSNAHIFASPQTSSADSTSSDSPPPSKKPSKLDYYASLRAVVKSYFDGQSNPSYTASSSGKRCSAQRPRSPTLKPRLHAHEFSISKPEHVKHVKQLGISVILLQDGRAQLVHNSAQANSLDDAEEGAHFMQEMISLSSRLASGESSSSMTSMPDDKLGAVSFQLSTTSKIEQQQVKVTLLAGPAQFGLDLSSADDGVRGQVARLPSAFDSCKLVEKRDPAMNVEGRILMVPRGQCMFIEKARVAQRMGAIGLIVVDTDTKSSSKNSPLFAMSSDGSNDVTIPTIFLYNEDAQVLFEALGEHPELEIVLHSQQRLFEESSVSSSNDQATVQTQQNPSTIHQLGIKSSQALNDLLESLKTMKRGNIDYVLSMFSGFLDQPELERAETSTPPPSNEVCINPDGQWVREFLIDYFKIVKNSVHDDDVD